METDVLIVGAGPTGLALALSLEKLGVRFRIIDKAPAPGTASRAIAVQARTLEMYDQLGFADDVVAAGLKLDKPTIWTKGRYRATIPFGDFGSGMSPHPFVLMYPQDEHEKFLISRLKTRVERPVSLLSFVQDGTGVVARVSSGETIRARYIAGCDGARSLVREALKTGFPGGTYEQMFYVADVSAIAIDHRDEFYIFLRERDFLLVLPLPQRNRFRLIGVVPEGVMKEGLTFNDLSPFVAAETPLHVTECHWFSTYHVHHRVTSKFRVGCAFLLGDAAHIHSPAGGQGMNTGIGDAFNLGWKLAAVLKHGAPDALLDTYETERHAFAKKLVATTDRLFTALVNPGFLSAFMRTVFLPRFIPFLMRTNFFRKLAFKTVSQLVVQYRESVLSEGQTGELHAGDRLPWVGNNFSPLQSVSWQVHSYGPAHPDLVAYCRQKNLPLIVFPETRIGGLASGGIYLVRPDGYIGFAGFETTGLRAYVDKWRI